MRASPPSARTNLDILLALLVFLACVLLALLDKSNGLDLAATAGLN